MKKKGDKHGLECFSISRGYEPDVLYGSYLVGKARPSKKRNNRAQQAFKQRSMNRTRDIPAS